MPRCPWSSFWLPSLKLNGKEKESLSSQNLYQSNIAKDNTKIKLIDYPHKLPPVGVHRTLLTLKVVVKEVEVEMEVVVIQ